MELGRGEQPRQRRGGVDVRVDTAHHVVDDWPDGDQIRDRIDAGIVAAKITDERQVPIDPLFTQVAEVQMDVSSMFSRNDLPFLLLADDVSSSRCFLQWVDSVYTGG